MVSTLRASFITTSTEQESHDPTERYYIMQVCSFTTNSMCVWSLSISDLQTSSTGWAIGIHRVHVDWLRSSDDKPISNWVTHNLSETKVTQYRIYTHQSIQYCRIYLSLHNFKVKQHLCEALSRTCKDTAMR